MRKHSYLIILALIMCQLVPSQRKEFLIQNSDTLRLIIEEQADYISGFAHESPIVTDDVESDQVTCWEIKNDSLFEVRLFNTDESFRMFHRDMNRTLYIPNGELLHDFGLTQVYSKERGIVIKNGIVIETKTYDNSSTRISPYSNMSNGFYDYITNLIEIEKLDFDNCSTLIFAIKKLNDANRIQDIEILRGCDKRTNNEIIRVIKTIPEWSVILLHGKETDYCKTIPVELNKIKSTTRQQ
ncbi:hypothetical protein E9993_14940 [Labilibacter sediminis]|nr:hypothetical protein E9993_14940 [Labilibacter sediminis]